ncbi:hypothetical protein EAH87_13875 [Sphingomonas koreensis]|nr:hypothetical protein EAH87_13875 [Sphingomonas koreensis]
MSKARDDHDKPFALRYGALEVLLTQLTGASTNAIVSRFRKLRPKFASDGLLTETGNRVSYDLTRVLAICATYELNSLSIPQGHAVDIVVANWPEIARACITAWDQRSHVGPNSARERSATVRIYIDAIQESPEEGSWASVASDPKPGTPHITLDCRPVIDALITAADASDQAEELTLAFAELESTFGWEALKEGDPERLPRRKGSDFFGTGPYFDRACVLLAVEPGQKLHRRRAARLQAVLDYLEEPAPIDSWKRFIGTDEGRPRLVHMLAAWGVALGLNSITIGDVGTLNISSFDCEAAFDLVQRGEKHVAKLVGETST